MSKKKIEKISFYKFFKRFPDEESAEKFFAERRWGKSGKKRFCPHCGSVRTVTMNHKMSKKHLQRYIDEYAGRHNVRPLATMD